MRNEEGADNGGECECQWTKTKSGTERNTMKRDSTALGRAEARVMASRALVGHDRVGNDENADELL